MSQEIRTRIEDQINSKIQFLVKEGAPYWAKITQFQIEYGGKDWKVVDAYDTGGHGNYEKCQLCGHWPCRYMFVIESRSGDRLTIGDECVINYCKDVTSREYLKKWNVRCATKIANLKRFKELMIKVAEWMNVNARSYFLTSVLRQMLEGREMTQRQITAIENVIMSQPQGMNVNVQNHRAEVDELLSKINVTTCNEWEQGFLVSIRDRIDHGLTLSERQLEVLKKIEKGICR